MTLRTHYRRAALAQRDYIRAATRVDRIGQILWNGRPDFLERWGDASRRARDVANERYLVFEILRNEARERMLFDPHEEMEKRALTLRFSAARRRSVS